MILQVEGLASVLMKMLYLWSSVKQGVPVNKSFRSNAQCGEQRQQYCNVTIKLAKSLEPNHSTKKMTIL